MVLEENLSILPQLILISNFGRTKRRGNVLFEPQTFQKRFLNLLIVWEDQTTTLIQPVVTDI